uniref:MAP3K12-binding inhibitory protein 1 n=1 Tax=Caligus clemensi TaxID=344056 RepID=C1C0B0_CALCM|nr:MAP3K12-binding inhibitory protein 1 [Caligus clemensi]
MIRMDEVSLSSEPLELNTSKLSFPSNCGATSVFFGSTRADPDEKGATVTKLFYEAYKPMAIQELKRICSHMRSKWEDLGPIRIVHRLGDVPVGEVSIIISVAAPRRDSAIRATEFALEKLELKVPIWKKEFYSNNVSKWKANQKAPSKSASMDMRNDKTNVQITASNEEIQRRIESFAERKRCEVDRNNILEFCNRHYSDENDDSCARTDSVLVRRQGSTSHYRQSKVVNTGSNESSSSNKNTPSQPKISRGTDERISALEDHLLPGKPIQKDIFARIKSLEDRVLYLEGISPEYFANVSANSKNEMEEDKEYISKEERKSELKKLLMDANLKIQELENSTQNIKDEALE